MAPPAREQWLQALREGNCLPLMQLLKDDPSLLKVTWEREPSRDAAQSQSLRASKGRNVLHVAAWRGCVELIRDVLRLCNLTEIDDLSRVDDQGAAAESKSIEDIAPATVGQSELADSEGAQRNDQNIASNEESSSTGDQQTLEESEQAAEEIGPADGGLEVPTRDLSNRQLRERGLEMAQRTVAHWKSRVEHGKVNRAQDAFTSEEREGKNLSTTSGHSLPNNDLRELLLAKDAEFGLQPIVMAGFHMNVNVLVLLGYAYGKCASDVLGWNRNIGSDPSPGPLVYVEDKAHRDNRARLRLVTEEFIAKFLDRDNSAQLASVSESEKRRATREGCIAKFLEDEEFNFLPIEEYCFHFICSTWEGDVEVIMEFWKEIRSFPGELWRFLLELKDGQGRTPIHAAMNRRGVENLLQILSDGKDDAEEVIVCALTTPDAATRTPAHTAAVLDDEELEAVLTYARQYDEVSASCRWTQQKSKFQLQRSCAPFHAAVLTRCYDCANLLIEASDELHWDDMSYYQHWWDSPIQDYPDEYDEFKGVEGVRWDPMEFACLVGADSSFVDFLKVVPMDPHQKNLQFPRHLWIPQVYDSLLSESAVGLIRKARHPFTVP
ncbi:unnamed protein product [Calypogeia fissa]